MANPTAIQNSYAVLKHLNEDRDAPKGAAVVPLYYFRSVCYFWRRRFLRQGIVNGLYADKLEELIEVATHCAEKIGNEERFAAYCLVETMTRVIANTDWVKDGKDEILSFLRCNQVITKEVSTFLDKNLERLYEKTFVDSLSNLMRVGIERAEFYNHMRDLFQALRLLVKSVDEHNFPFVGVLTGNLHQQFIIAEPVKFYRGFWE